MRILVGHVSVDSGQVMVGDPCYLDEWKANEFVSGNINPPFTYDYDGACGASCSDLQAGELSHSKAVCTSSGYGDGTYPVFIEKNRDGRVIRMTVEFDFEEFDFEEDEE